MDKISEIPVPPRVKKAPRLRWYQFRLRTLFIGITLYCIALGPFGQDIRIVYERMALLRRLEAAGGSAGPQHLNYEYWRSVGCKFDEPVPSISRFRQWLGDEEYSWIVIPAAATSIDEVPYKTAFPEAAVSRDSPGYIINSADY